MVVRILSSLLKTIESDNIASWRGPTRVVEFNSLLLIAKLKLNQVSKSIILMLLELYQAGCRGHFSEENILTDNPLCEELFPHVHSKPS